MTQNIGENIVKNRIRYDFEIIANLIKPESKILDIGCGDGELLESLKKKNIDARGLELSQIKVSKALSKGLSVIQGDAEKDLEFYPDKNFDYAILSQTIQATHKPKEVLKEMLRIAEYGIVSLPNFANIKNRFHLLLKGRMPVNKNIPFQWYETPNIHFCSIKDFENLCLEMNISIEKKFFLTSKQKLISFFGCDTIANIFAEYGIFLIKKNEFTPTAQEEFAFSKNLKKKMELGFSAPNAARVISKE